MNFKNIWLVALLFLSLTALSENSYAAYISILPSGSGDSSFNVQGTAMEGVYGIKVDVGYDPLSLSTPTVQSGPAVAGAMFAANTSRPGFINIAIISTNPVSANGQVATISFATRSGKGGITSISSNFIDKSGSPLLSKMSGIPSEKVSIAEKTTPGIPFSDVPQVNKSSQDREPHQTSISATSLPNSETRSFAGTVSLPPVLEQKIDDKPVAEVPQADYTADHNLVIAAEQKEHLDKKIADKKPENRAQTFVYKGIIERFKRYKGEKKLQIMATLFDKAVAHNIIQEPAVLISDGKRGAILKVDLSGNVSSSPNFAVNGGKLIKVARDKQVKGRWNVEILPEIDSSRVILTVITGGDGFDYTMTVAPKAKTALTIDENGWKIFLKETGTVKTVKHDLNSDGVRDYLDEYIFVANYLAKKRAD